MPCQDVNEKRLLRLLMQHRTGISFHRFGRSLVNRNWQVTDRCLSDHYLQFIISESNLATIDGRDHVLRPNTVLYLAPYVSHTMRTHDPRAPHRFFHMRFTLECDDRILGCRRKMVLLQDAHQLKPLFKEIYHEYYQDDPLSEERLRAMLALLLSRVFQSAEADVTDGGLSPQQRMTIREYVDARVHQAIHPHDLAALLDYNPAYFTRLFRRSFGKAPKTWLMEERIRHAAMLLVESQLNVSEVAHELGYKDVYLFSRQFKQVIGCSPSRYRA